MSNIAIIGIGGISKYHLEAYINAGQNIVALCDILEERALKSKEKYKLNCKVYTDYHQMLNDEMLNIDLVDICTPPSLHCEMTVAALETGNHVIVEKPMATSIEETRKMLEAEKKSGKLLSPIAQNRFRDEISILKNILNDDIIGKALLTEVKSNWYRGQHYYDLKWRGTFESEGGGANISQAIHHIDMIIWLKELPKELNTIMSNVNHDNSEVEDLSVTNFLFEDNTLGTLVASTISHGEEQSVHIQGEKASVSQPMKVRSTVSQYNGFPEKENTENVNAVEKYIEKAQKLKYTHHEGQIRNVLAAIEGKENLLISGQDGANTIEVLYSIYKSYFTKSFVSLPINEDDPFYTKDGVLKQVKAFNKKYRVIDKFDTEITVGNFNEENDEKN